MVGQSEQGADSTGKPTPAVSTESKNKELLPGDLSCTTCAGYFYVTKEMMERGQAARCFGWKSQAPQSLDHMSKQVHLLDKRADSSNVLQYSGFGKCFWTQRMQRLGMVPIIVGGVEYTKRRSPQTQQQSQQKQLTNAQGVKTDDLSPPASSGQVVDTSRSLIPTWDQLRRFVTRFVSSSFRLTESMKKTSSYLVTDVPDKLERSTIRLWNSSLRTVDHALDYVLGDYEDDDDEEEE